MLNVLHAGKVSVSCVIVVAGNTVAGVGVPLTMVPDLVDSGNVVPGMTVVPAM